MLATAESERRPMSEARQYELVYVVSPEITDEGVTELHERIAEIVGQLGGNIDKTDNWGRRRLAYEIDRHREGSYVIELITGPGTLVTELERRLRVMEQLLRYLVVRVDEDLRKAQRARERRQSRQQRRVAKRGSAALDVPPASGSAPAVAPESAPTGVPAAAPAAASETPKTNVEAPLAAAAVAASEPTAPAAVAEADAVAQESAAPETGEPVSAAAASETAAPEPEITPTAGKEEAAETAEVTDE